jgi:hypothetical protein
MRPSVLAANEGRAGSGRQIGVDVQAGALRSGTATRTQRARARSAASMREHGAQLHRAVWIHRSGSLAPVVRPHRTSVKSSVSAKLTGTDSQGPS